MILKNVLVFFVLVTCRSLVSLVKAISEEQWDRSHIAERQGVGISV